MDNYTSNQHFGEKDPVTGLVNNNPNRMIPWSKLQEIIDDCAEMGVRSCEITGGGEPTVHPKHKELFQYILDKKIDLALVTNGVIMRDNVPEILSNAKWIRVSIDAGIKETYARMRETPISYFDKVIGNKKLKGKKNENKIGLHYWGRIRCLLKLERNLAATKLFKISVDNVRITILHRYTLNT
jgi:MoaA/NifB/PqqE/SkfB family radical SAM enzyme